MKTILKTLALLTAGVGAVAVVKRAKNQKEDFKRSIFVNGKTREINKPKESPDATGSTKKDQEYLKIIENVKKRNEERADGWKTSVTVIRKENPKDDLIIIH